MDLVLSRVLILNLNKTTSDSLHAERHNQLLGRHCQGISRKLIDLSKSGSAYLVRQAYALEGVSWQYNVLGIVNSWKTHHSIRVGRVDRRRRQSSLNLEWNRQR